MKGTMESNVCSVVRWYNLTYEKGKQHRFWFRISVRNDPHALPWYRIIEIVKVQRQDLEFYWQM
jgi:hypothetical protein